MSSSEQGIERRLATMAAAGTLVLSAACTGYVEGDGALFSEPSSSSEAPAAAPLTSLPPASLIASSTARRSTSDDSLAMHASTRGQGKRDTPTRFRTTSIIRWVMSNSVISRR